MDWTKRSDEKEELDDLSFSGEALTKSLDELSWVHRYLGGHQITVQMIKKALKRLELKEEEPVHILDAGCGGGDSLRSIASWLTQRDMQAELTGVDGNAATVAYAKERSKDFPHIQFRQANFLKESFSWQAYDIVLFSLVLHHFTNGQIKSILSRAADAGVSLICINDLHRHPLAYYLFRTLTPIIGFSKVSREDGLLSIKKAFQRDELEQLLEETGYADHTIKWKWAFRYEVIAALSV